MDSVNIVQMIEWHISFKNQIIHEYVVCDLRSRLGNRPSPNSDIFNAIFTV